MQPEETCSATVVDAIVVADVRARLADETLVDATTAIFSALSDRTRLRILDALSVTELCVCDLAAVCGISQSGVSHQLRLLRDRGLVAFRRDGNRAVYRLADTHVVTLLAQGLAHAAERGVRR
jgi:ArsR family transcriptional regulator, lead/cadmium/zinc/bismuth-responsive transcriptional repressor